MNKAAQSLEYNRNDVILLAQHGWVVFSISTPHLECYRSRRFAEMRAEALAHKSGGSVILIDPEGTPRYLS